MKRLCTALLIFCCCCAAWGAEKPQQYQVELLIYSHFSPAAIGSEYWNAGVTPGLFTNKHAITLDAASSDPLDDYPTRSYLPDSSWTLSRAAQRIESRMHGQVLYHQAWRVSREQLRHKTLRFVITDQIPKPIIASDENEDTTATAPAGSIAPSKLTGVFSIHLTRYFNTKLQLTLSEPSNAIKPYLKEHANPCDDSGICYFSFESSRRTRSRLLNYLDHPLYGALLEITPVTGLKGQQPAASNSGG